MRTCMPYRQWTLIVLLITFILVTVWGAFPCTGVADEVRCKIGILEEPKTLNIWLASDAWSRKVLSQIYQPLYIREPKNADLIPWLAEGEPVFDEHALAYTVRLRQAKWSDGSDFTAEDVTFTGNLIKEFKVPRNYAQWEFVKKIETVDEHTVKFFLERPVAIFLTKTLSTPIVQKEEWESVAADARNANNPIDRLLKHKVEKPVGTGPFVLHEWRQGAYVFLKKNDFFFGTGKDMAGYRLGPYLDGLVLRQFGTPDAAILALRKGSIDMFWSGIQAGYLDDLIDDENVKIYASEKSALYYLGFNLRKAPFNDVLFRRAVATLVDKVFIVKRILQGHAEIMNSVVPPGNAFWHCSDVSRYGEGLGREARIREAYKILHGAGYDWEVPPVDQEGKFRKGKGILMPDGKPMERITILTPPADYDPLRAMAGIMVQEWLKMVGIPAGFRPTGFGSLIDRTKNQRDFDLFVLGYGNLSLDPDYLRSFFHSNNDKMRGWNVNGYRNPEYDRISEKSARAMDRNERRILIWDMQKIIMRDLPLLPLYNPKLLEAVRTDRFAGWVPMLGGIGNTWSFCTLRPR